MVFNFATVTFCLSFLLFTDTACARFVNDTRPIHNQPASGPTHSATVQIPTTLPKNINVLQDQQSKNTAFNNPLYSPGAGAVSPIGVDVSDIGFTNPMLSRNLATDPNIATASPPEDRPHHLVTDPNFSINLDPGTVSSVGGVHLLGVTDHSQC